MEEAVLRGYNNDCWLNGAKFIMRVYENEMIGGELGILRMSGSVYSCKGRAREDATVTKRSKLSSLLTFAFSLGCLGFNPFFY
jgi:hypothetical protein